MKSIASVNRSNRGSSAETIGSRVGVKPPVELGPAERAALEYAHEEGNPTVSR